MLNFEAISLECEAYSRAKGYLPTTMDNAAIRLKAIDKEISELTEEIRKGCGRGMSFESADVAIYSVVIMRDLGCTVWDVRQRMHIVPEPFDRPAELTAPLRKYGDLAFEAWQKADRKHVIMSLELLLAQLVDLRVRCLRLPNSLQFDMALKLAFMRSRERCHGGKDPRS